MLKKKTRGFGSLSSKNDSSNSSDRGVIFSKKSTRRRAGMAQRCNLSKQDSSNSNETEIFPKKRNRRRAEIAQLYNLSEQDSSNSSEREVSPKKKSKGKRKTRVARHFSKHASSCTEDREQEELAVRQCPMLQNWTNQKAVRMSGLKPLTFMR